MILTIDDYDSPREVLALHSKGKPEFVQRPYGHDVEEDGMQCSRTVPVMNISTNTQLTRTERNSLLRAARAQFPRTNMAADALGEPSVSAQPVRAV